MAAADTIVALSTGSLPSGVAVVRMSGPAVEAVLETVVGDVPPARRLSLRAIRAADDAVLDRALVAWFPAPHSFTGENCAELQVHGSPAVVKALLRRLTALPGVRLAEAGEFTRRAFERGRLDWLEVEGLADILAAETESQLRLASARADGALSKRVAVWREALLDLRAEIEAQLDFSDESDVGEGLGPAFGRNLAALRADISEILATAESGRIVREGFRVALAGPPNVGKSSLLNALTRADVAIVTDEAGTTRDVHETEIDLAGRLVVLVDMAGLTDTDSKAEREGVRRARAELERADLVLWLVAPDVADTADYQDADPRVWRIGTKSDIGQVADVKLSISTATGANMQTMLETLGAHVLAATGAGESALVSHERDRVALGHALTALDGAARADAPELVAEHLREATLALERLIGKVDAEAVLDQLFSRFCIGK
jgi:tRNA modification GTPase